MHTLIEKLDILVNLKFYYSNQILVKINIQIMTESLQLVSFIKGQRQKAIIKLHDWNGQVIKTLESYKNKLPAGIHTEEDLFNQIPHVLLNVTRQIVIASTQNPCLYRCDGHQSCLTRILEICHQYPHLEVTIVYCKPCWSDVRYLYNVSLTKLPYQDQFKKWVVQKMHEYRHPITNLRILRCQKSKFIDILSEPK